MHTSCSILSYGINDDWYLTLMSVFCFIELLFDPGWYRHGTSFLGVLIIVRYYAFSTLVFNSPVLIPSHVLDIYTCSLDRVLCF